ncbi:hypothetical protein [Pseudacidovorax intermedius]|uniref:hypothetical protein n=1 Tax=Pseudacidovorax intermedius TaxID=433924 RepID=UPI00128EE4AD|nr:hypothetical protein [Pseudacidovorax intermedius]
MMRLLPPISVKFLAARQRRAEVRCSYALWQRDIQKVICGVKISSQSLKQSRNIAWACLLYRRSAKRLSLKANSLNVVKGSSNAMCAVGFEACEREKHVVIRSKANALNRPSDSKDGLNSRLVLRNRYIEKDCGKRDRVDLLRDARQARGNARCREPRAKPRFRGSPAVGPMAKPQRNKNGHTRAYRICSVDPCFRRHSQPLLSDWSMQDGVAE